MPAAQARRRARATWANVHRLLADEGQLVLVFPEGRQGTGEALPATATACSASAAAASSRRPCAPARRSCPLAVVGAEEAQPILRPRAACSSALTGLIYFPVTPTFRCSGPLGILALPCW